MYICTHVCLCVCAGGNNGSDRTMQDFSDNVQHFCKNGKPVWRPACTHNIITGALA